MEKKAVPGGPATGRKPYRAPKLTVFGNLARLTQNGTGLAKESNGKSLCGGNFQRAGGASC
jgi:hypothetical protein